MPRNEADEVSDNVAFCEVGIIVSVGIHLIHRARSPFPLRGRLGNEILAGEVKSSTKMKSDRVRLNVSPIPTLTHA